MKFKKLKSLREAVLGISMSLALLEEDLDTINDNILYLSRIENDLVYNIKLHKSDQVVTVITEYRRSIQELGVIRKEIKEFKAKKETVKRRIKNKMESYDHYIDKLDQEFERLYNDKVVLPFRGREDG